MVLSILEDLISILFHSFNILSCVKFQIFYLNSDFCFIIAYNLDLNFYNFSDELLHGPRATVYYRVPISPTEKEEQGE